MNSLNNLKREGKTAGGVLPNAAVQSYAERAERRMLLEQVAMTMLAVSLFLAIL